MLFPNMAGACRLLPLWLLLCISVTASALALSACEREAVSKHPDGMTSHRWYEVQTPHLQVQGNLDKDELEAMAQEFERLQAILEQVLFGRALGLDAQTRVIVFRTVEEFDKVTGRNGAAGFFLPKVRFELGSQPTLVIHGKLDLRRKQLFLHEMTHRLLNFAMDGKPIWLDEGLAEYYGAMQIEGNNLVLGENPDDIELHDGLEFDAVNVGTGWRARVPLSSMLPPSQLLNLSRQAFYGPKVTAKNEIDAARQHATNYASAWAFVHMLMNGPEDLQQRFAKGFAAAAQGQNASAAIEDSLRDVSLEQLDEAYFRHLKRKETVVWRTAVPKVATTTTQTRSLDEGEIASVAVRIGLDPAGKVSRSAQTRLAQLSSQQPPMVSALYQLGMIKYLENNEQEGKDLLLRASKRDGDNLRVVATLLAVSSNQTDELNQLLLSLSTRATASIDHWLIAIAFGNRGKKQEALDAAKKSVQADPSCSTCLVTYATTTFEQGDAARAVVLQRLAIERLHEFAAATYREALQNDLERYQAAANN